MKLSNIVLASLVTASFNSCITKESNTINSKPEVNTGKFINIKDSILPTTDSVALKEIIKHETVLLDSIILKPSKIRTPRININNGSCPGCGLG